MGLFDEVWHLPLNWFGLNDIPAVPIELSGLVDTALRLYSRTQQTKPARNGLTNSYTIGGHTATGQQFLYGDAAASDAEQALKALADDKPGVLLSKLQGVLSHRGDDRSALPQFRTPPGSLQALSLDQPAQFAIAWTNFQDIYGQYQTLIPDYAATLTDPEAATQRFWPTIAANGLAFNLLMLRKVGTAELNRLRGEFGKVWAEAWSALAERGLLYVIDLSIFAGLPPATVHNFTRFTPATITLLAQEPASKALIPIAVRVSGQDVAAARYFVRGNASASGWLYALQAAKTSVTVYGIWLGHVYHWHIVSAAMQMTMYNTLPTDHPAYRLVAPQSRYLFQFDEILLLLWSQIAPPTSVDTPFGFLDLMNRFAGGRHYFADDPTTTLHDNGIASADFTRGTPWDAYPTAGLLLDLWSDTAAYVKCFVDNTYASDAAVAEDRFLQDWMRQAADPGEGNIGGLPAVKNRALLAQVLTSLIYRITAHGISRLRPSAYPAQAFVANFPPCLQDATIPPPDVTLSTAQLLAYLPKTGTIGEMMTFYTIFVFSRPYERFIPEAGVDADLFFPGGLDDPRNRALVEFREAVIAIMKRYAPGETMTEQWPLNIET